MIYRTVKVSSTQQDKIRNIRHLSKKIIRHAKKQENMTHYENKSIKNDRAMKNMIELVNKDIKIIIVIVFHIIEK